MMLQHNSSKRFNALLATASINDAIEYYELFKDIQKQETKEDENVIPLNIACVFSPPAQPPRKGTREPEECS
jgi:type I restriction enzyme R subunit